MAFDDLDHPVLIRTEDVAPVLRLEIPGMPVDIPNENTMIFIIAICKESRKRLLKPGDAVGRRHSHMAYKGRRMQGLPDAGRDAAACGAIRSPFEAGNAREMPRRMRRKRCERADEMHANQACIACRSSQGRHAASGPAHHARQRRQIISRMTLDAFLHFNSLIASSIWSIGRTWL